MEPPSKGCGPGARERSLPPCGIGRSGALVCSFVGMTLHPGRMLLAVLALLFIPHVSAQPYRMGCMVLRDPYRPGQTASPMERAQIDATIARSDTFDILHYDIRLDVTRVQDQWLQGACTVDFTPRMAGQSMIRFDLLDLTVDSVTSILGAHPFTHDGAFLVVDLLAVPAIGEQRSLTVHYQGMPHRDPDWGGFYFESGYIYNLGIGISTIPPNFGKVWYPCFDSFVERATYTYHVKSAGAYRLRGQGDFLGEVQLGGDTVVRSYGIGRALPTHVSAVAVSNYVDSTYLHAGAYGSIPVTLSAKPAQLAGMVSRFGDLPGAIDALEFWYGPYGWGRVGYVLTTDGALEIPTNIAYPQFMTGQPVGDNRQLLSHELGHHWWGDIVTPYIHNDMWVKEGPAEYSGHLVDEWSYGREAFVGTVLNNHYDVLKNSHVVDDGFQALSPMPDPHIYGHHTYYKGASVMHNLRGYLGDTLFRQAMHGVQAVFADTALTAAGFRDALEQVTGADLNPFFDAWVFAPGFSVFVVESMQAQPQGGQWEVEVTLRQLLRGTTVLHEQVPLDLTLIGAGWQRGEHQVVAGGALTTVTLTSPFAPEMVVVNGHRRLNQARMDHEFTMRPGESFSSTLPRVDFRVFPETVIDSALFRVDHIWAGPEATLTTAEVEAISGTHYWVVDGLWPEGNHLSARITYYGASESQLDFDLFDATEAGAAVLYRAHPGEPWTTYAHQVVVAGSLTNGTGYMELDTLLKGEYALGRSGAIASVPDPGADGEGLVVFPVPATDRLHVEVPPGLVAEELLLRDAEGRTLLRQQATRDAVQVMPVAGTCAQGAVLEVRTRTGDILRRPVVLTK